jgi:DNA polymerase-2
MKGFIVHSTYRFDEGKPHVYLFGRLKNGESFLTCNEYRPYFYIRETDLKEAEQAEAWDYFRSAKTKITFDAEKTEFTSKNGNKVVKLYTAIPKHVSLLKEAFEKKGIKTYEADIPFERRFLIDKKIHAVMEIKGSFSRGEHIDRIYVNPELEPCEEYKVEPRVLFFDIETDPKASTVLSIAIKCGQFRQAFLVSDRHWNRARSFKTEKEMLEAFREKVFELDPDFIINHYVINFDFSTLRNRFDALGLNFDFGRIPGRTKMKVEHGWGRTSSMDIIGRCVFDSIDLLKLFGIKLGSYSLENASRVLLGKGKLIASHNKADEIYRQYKEDTQKFIDYNLQDVDLVGEICEKKNLIELIVEMSLLTGLQPDKTKGKIATFDNIYQKHLQDIKKVSPSVKGYAQEEELKGGFVAESTPGFYECTLIFDYTSFYSTMIWTMSIDPLTYLSKPPRKLDPEKYVIAPNGAVFKNVPKTILGDIMIKDFLEKKAKAKKIKDTIKSNAIKIQLNAMSFGIFANANNRWSSMAFTNAITSFCRELGHVVEKEINRYCREELKLLKAKIFYRDTDSYFLNTGITDYEKAKALAPVIAKHANDFLNKYILEHYHRESHLYLDYETPAKRFFMPAGRKKKAELDASGVKKKYCGLYEDHGSELLEFTGMEYVHTDATDLAKEFQYGLYWRIFHDQDYKKYIADFISRLNNGEFDDKLVYTMNMTKNAADYTKTTPPHVKAARVLQQHGLEIPHTIQYVITTDGPRPVELIDQPMDYEHYIEKQIKPIAEEVLAFLHEKFDELTKDKKQKTLPEY